MGAPPPDPPGILVVDDEVAVLRSLEAVLRLHGFTVFSASGGEEAVRLYQAHRGAIRLALLDVRMPGWDGPRTLAELRQLNPRLPCCYITGYTPEYSADQLLATGATHVFPKPVAPIELVETLRRLCGPSV